MLLLNVHTNGFCRVRSHVIWACHVLHTGHCCPHHGARPLETESPHVRPCASVTLCLRLGTTHTTATATTAAATTAAATTAVAVAVAVAAGVDGRGYVVGDRGVVRGADPAGPRLERRPDQKTGRRKAAERDDHRQGTKQQGGHRGLPQQPRSTDQQAAHKRRHDTHGRVEDIQRTQHAAALCCRHRGGVHGSQAGLGQAKRQRGDGHNSRHVAPVSDGCNLNASGDETKPSGQL